MADKILDAFRLQAAFCRETGSSLTGRVLESLAVILDHSTRTGARILDWPGDPMVDALKLRIAGGLNALARFRQDAELSALYTTGEGDWHGTLRRVLHDWDEWLYPWLDSAPQTNEVARAGVLWPGLKVIAERFGPKLELLEIGASGGLNLNMDRFAYDLGGAKSGDQASDVKIAPHWNGPPPPSAAINILARSGVDLNPLDLTDPAIAEHMLAYIWPDQTERVARAEAAIDVAQAFPPQVEAEDGAAWIERKLAEPQGEGVTRVVYHSVALQYFPPEGRARVKAAIEAAGARATGRRPLAWLSMEFPGRVTTAHLTLATWPGTGEIETLALAHPHGASVNWGCVESS